MGRLTHRTHPGCTYFVTTDTFQKRVIFQVAEVARIVVKRLLACRDQGAFLLHEFVLMPNHLHLLLTPGSNTSLEKAMMLIKGGSSHEIHRVRGNKMEIWHSGFHDSTIRDAADFESRAKYIRMNPVVAKLAEKPEDWIHGSASRKFLLDSMPERVKAVSSGAKAQVSGIANVGAKAPTP
jgi:putative transposase